MMLAITVRSSRCQVKIIAHSAIDHLDTFVIVDDMFDTCGSLAEVHLILVSTRVYTRILIVHMSILVACVDLSVCLSLYIYIYIYIYMYTHINNDSVMHAKLESSSRSLRLPLSVLLGPRSSTVKVGRSCYMVIVANVSVMPLCSSNVNTLEFLFQM